MKIQISRDALCGNIAIPRGDYWVSLNTESGEVNLAAGGKDIRIPAKKRKAKVQGKTTQISFYCGGGNFWSLVVAIPKRGEWIAILEYTRKD